jgi:hypothetical protein
MFSYSNSFILTEKVGVMYVASGGSFEKLTLTDKGCAQEKSTYLRIIHVQIYFLDVL